MDTKVFLLVLFITLTAVQGAIPRCCVATTRVPLAILRDVQKYDVQNRKGACEIDAVLLHYKGKTYCANPRVKRILQTMQKLKLGGRNSV